MSSRTWLVTGAAGFIGSNFVHLALDENWCNRVVAVDLLTYAGNLENLERHLGKDDRLAFHRVDVTDASAIRAILAQEKPATIFHLAAESHVDRSIEDPAPFIRTNVLGTQVLLDAARRAGVPRFLLVSTDEVYGSLALDSQERFHEGLPLTPSSPYAASKAASDLLALAAHHTHGQDVVITRCSNNYGPYQFPEKLIPLMIMNAVAGEPLPVYGDGLNVRDWIHVSDHCRALRAAAEHGLSGHAYNIGSDNERPNIDVVKTLLKILDRPESLIKYVKDRPGHDRRYAIDAAKAHRELGWQPRVPFERGLRETAHWYLENAGWMERIRSGEFLSYYERMYAGR
ncbi:MAG: dTDP-glucose 4,6-dehydratase [Candidatus Sumerlaeia bacterium]|nr:dTDP-glucose 4,6-dehydratase [Candidatus Sumerlaeia bacterium]